MCLLLLLLLMLLHARSCTRSMSAGCTTIGGIGRYEEAYACLLVRVSVLDD